jgi:hypothetical protein
MKYFKSILKRFIYFFAKRTSLINLNYYRIDGGLGAQIIGYLIFMQAKNKNSNVFCDVSFFRKQSDDNVFLTNTYRSWGLGHFGITIESIENNSVLKFWDTLKFKPNDEYFGKQFENFMKNYNEELSSLIPHLGLEQSLLIKHKLTNHEYSVIHIRKGDFLKQSSYLIKDSAYINLIKSLKDTITSKVFIVSDEKLHIDFTYQIKQALYTKEVIFEDTATEIEIHCLMRSAKILVTSNSMFSLSAALLRPKELLTITPKVFFGNKFKSYNSGINSLSEWAII